MKDRPLQQQTTIRVPDELLFLAPLIVEDLQRFGVEGDGGYVLPASVLEQIDAMTSFGMFFDWSLEKHMHQLRPNMPIHTYDHTIQWNRFVIRALGNIGKLVLGKTTPSRVRSAFSDALSYRQFFRENRHHYQERIHQNVQLDNDADATKVFSRIPDAKHVFVKMDIEGSEYRVIPGLVDFADRIDLMVIEFHDIDPFRRMFIEHMSALLQPFEIVHLHANNFSSQAADGFPDVIEVTLVNRRFVKSAGLRRSHLPLPDLDKPCDQGRSDYEMRF